MSPTSSLNLVVNGEPYEAPGATSVAGLISALKLQNQRLAIEVNGELVPRAAWTVRELAAADRIEIVRAIGGG